MQQLTSQLRDVLLPVAGRIRRHEWGDRDDAVLIFQPDHLGDILLSQPAVQCLRGRFPSSTLIAVVGPWSREITSMAWPVDEIVALSFPGFTRDGSGSSLAPYRQLHVEARRLEPIQARSAFILRPDAWWAAWLASRVVPSVVTADVPRSRQFATRPIPIAVDEHAAIRAARIAAEGDVTALPTRSSSPLHLRDVPGASTEVDQLLQKHQIEERFVVIHPGSGAAVKEWPAHRWRAVAEALANQGSQVVLTGSSSEAELCEAIAGSDPRRVSLAGNTSLPVLAEIMRRAAIALGPDSGPLHLAVAVGTPSVHLFGPSDAGRYGPWGDPARHRVVSAGWSCPRCGDLSPHRGPGCGCMLAIQPDDVLDAARSVLTDHAR